MNLLEYIPKAFMSQLLHPMAILPEDVRHKKTPDQPHRGPSLHRYNLSFTKITVYQNNRTKVPGSTPRRRETPTKVNQSTDTRHSPRYKKSVLHPGKFEV